MEKSEMRVFQLKGTIILEVTLDDFRKEFRKKILEFFHDNMSMEGIFVQISWRLDTNGKLLIHYDGWYGKYGSRPAADRGYGHWEETNVLSPTFQKRLATFIEDIMVKPFRGGEAREVEDSMEWLTYKGVLRFMPLP